MTSEIPPDDSGNTIQTIRSIAGVVFLVVLAAFILANLDDVEINFLLFTVRTKMLVAMVISAILGAIAALLISGHGLIFGIGRRKDRR